MKSNAPWSVKGIDRDAREAAKEAARREGMTVGEWLNHVIMSAGDDAVDAGEIEGLGIRDIAVAVEHISRRIARAEEKSADTAETLARSLGGAVERLQRLERARPAENAPEDIARRLATLEEKSSDRQRIDALRALERAVAQVAIQFDTAHKSSVARIAETERQLAALGERLDSAPGAGDASVAFLREAVERLAERVARAESLAEDAARQAQSAPSDGFDPEFVEKTGLRMRILGDEIKRGGDRMRALEGSISKLVEQIDAAERRSAEGVQKVAETIADLRRQFSDADASDAEAARRDFEAAVATISERTENRIEALQRSFDELVRRLETAGADRRPAAMAAPMSAAAAPMAAAPAPEISVALDEESIFDDDIDEAFAEIDLDAPAEPRAAAPAAPAPGAAFLAAAAPAASAAPAPASDEDFDDFDLDFDDSAGGGAANSDETETVIDEVRAAFGFAPQSRADAREDDAASAAFGDIGLDDEDDDAPPVVFGRKHKTEPETEDAPADDPAPAGDRAPDDFLKRARLAAREAAAAAAEAEDKPGERRQLTARQRAVLAARMKRRKLEDAARGAAQAAPAAALSPADAADAPSARTDDEDDAPASVKSKVMAAIARLKARPGAAKAASRKADPGDADASAGKSAAPPHRASKSESPSIVGGLGAAAGTVRARPAVAGLVAAIALAGAALFFLVKDVVFDGGGAKRSDADPAAPDVAAPPALVDAAADATTRPRELYLDSYAALKAAQTDAEERAALKGIEEAAALGHPPAQLQIGEFYKIGQGFEKDLTRARQWYERAANGGNVLAMHRLGVMAARGEGGAADLSASVAWFEKAALLGLVDSQYNLGATYHPTPDDAGGVQDRGKAYFWYSVAAKNGDAQAGSLAAGLSSGLPRAEKDRLDAEIAAFAPVAQDPIANEISPAG